MIFGIKFEFNRRINAELQKWAYNVVLNEYQPADFYFEVTLNNAGKNGWKLVRAT